MRDYNLDDIMSEFLDLKNGNPEDAYREDTSAEDAYFRRDDGPELSAQEEPAQPQYAEQWEQDDRSPYSPQWERDAQSQYSRQWEPVQPQRRTIGSLFQRGPQQEQAVQDAPTPGERMQKLGQGLRGGLSKLHLFFVSLLVVLRQFFGKEKDQQQQPVWIVRTVFAVFLLISVLCASWILHNVHPGSGTTVRGKPSALLAQRIEPDAASPGEESVQSPEQTDGTAAAPVSKKHYVIERDAVAAPDPDPACFGSISINEPEKVMEVIQKARDYGLLAADETVAFDPGATFYYDEDIEYYLDETILVIVWKEVIDGNTCSFAEVKLADASQFRRKLADDTFASANQYYSSVLHKSTNAVLSLNADFYQNRDFGVVVYNSELYRFPTGTYTGSYKKYNCLETCFVDDQGNFLFTELGQTFTQEELEQYIADNNILFSISFGPVLIRDGEVRECDWYPVGEINKGYSRAGIGQVDSLHYLYMSLNHSPEAAARWTVNQFAQHFGEKPVKNAYCLDGGQTAEIVFQGRPYNHVDYGEERPVSDNIYFATAITKTEGSK